MQFRYRLAALAAGATCLCGTAAADGQRGVPVQGPPPLQIPPAPTLAGGPEAPPAAAAVIPSPVYAEPAGDGAVRLSDSFTASLTGGVGAGVENAFLGGGSGFFIGGQPRFSGVRARFGSRFGFARRGVVRRGFAGRRGF